MTFFFYLASRSLDDAVRILSESMDALHTMPYVSVYQDQDNGLIWQHTVHVAILKSFWLESAHARVLYGGKLNFYIRCLPVLQNTMYTRAIGGLLK